MNKDLNHSIFDETDCLSEQMLFDYIDKKLSPKENHVVEKHLLSCELCSDALDGLQMVKDRKRIAILNQQINERVAAPLIEETTKVVHFNYKKVVISIAASVLLLIGGIFFFNMLNKQKDLAQNKLSDAVEVLPPPPPASSIDKDIATAQNEETKQGETHNKNYEATEAPLENETNYYRRQERSLNDEQAAHVSAVKTPSPTLSREAEPAPKEEIATAQNGLSMAKDESIAEYKKAEKSVQPSPNEAEGAAAASISYGANYEELGDVVVTTSTSKNKRDKAPKSNEYSTRKGREKAAEADASAPRDEESLAADALSQNNMDDAKAVAKVQASTSAVSGNTLQEAQFPSGKDSLVRFIRKNFSTTVLNQHQAELQQAIEAEFTVTKNGAVKNITIVTATTPEVEQELHRVLQLMPKWNPAIINGEAVPKKIRLPIKIIE